jgi:DNA-binding GntR family transcriptional regulator
VKYRATTGRLKPGDRLTAADLAVTRWVTMTTAAAALADLAEDGLLESLPDGAYAVRERPAGMPEFAPDQYAWLQLANFLAGRIKADEFAAAGKLPGEAVLGRQYRVGRQTVRRARNELAERGLIFYRRGFGFYIA